MFIVRVSLFHIWILHKGTVACEKCLIETVLYISAGCVVSNVSKIEFTLDEGSRVFNTNPQSDTTVTSSACEGHPITCYKL